MESKVCFECGRLRLLSEFEKNERFNLPTDFGTMKVCKDCDLLKTLKTLSNVRFDKEQGKFIVNKFENHEEVVRWYREHNLI